jgi:hypothetical protein
MAKACNRVVSAVEAPANLPPARNLSQFPVSSKAAPAAEESKSLALASTIRHANLW